MKIGILKASFFNLDIFETEISFPKSNMPYIEKYLNSMGDIGEQNDREMLVY